MNKTTRELETEIAMLTNSVKMYEIKVGKLRRTISNDMNREMNRLKLNKQELKYLTIIIEENLEKNNSFMNMNNEDFMNMLHDLYSKLIIMED